MFSDSVTGRSDQVRSGGPFQRILAATDFSQTAGLALEYAHVLAKQFHSKLYVVHVVSKEMYFVRPNRLARRLPKQSNMLKRNFRNWRCPPDWVTKVM